MERIQPEVADAIAFGLADRDGEPLAGLAGLEAFAQAPVQPVPRHAAAQGKAQDDVGIGEELDVRRDVRVEAGSLEVGGRRPVGHDAFDRGTGLLIAVPLARHFGTRLGEQFRAAGEMFCLAAIARGAHESEAVDCFMVYCKQGEPYARISLIRIKNVEKADWAEIGSLGEVPLTYFDIILMRKDPPFDLEYIYATYALELAEREGVLIANKPQGLRDANEKFFTLLV